MLSKTKTSMPFSVWVILIFSQICLSSCGQTETKSQVTIYGGHESVPEAWASVVAISDKSLLFCTGTALTPTLIVTAAHCVTDETLDDLRVATGVGVEGHEARGEYKVLKMGYSPRFDKYDMESAFDVGYLVLSTPLDLPPEAYIKVLAQPDEVKEMIIKGKESYLVGFGARNDYGYGVKYEVMSPIRKVLANEVKIGAKGKDACQGDSGGPAFAKLKSSGEWRLFGITSRGGECGDGGFWGLLNKSICWVQKDSGVTLDLPEGYCPQ